MEAFGCRSIAAWKVSAVSRPLSGSTSAKITSAPQKRAALAVARKVIAGTTTLSPGPRSSAMQARCSAAVPLLLATANFAPTACANAASKAPTAGPVVR